MFTFFFNQMSYDADSYDDKTIKRHVEWDGIPMNKYQRYVQRYFLRKRTLESEERYLGDGFFPREEEFYTFEKDE